MPRFLWSTARSKKCHLTKTTAYFHTFLRRKLSRFLIANCFYDAKYLQRPSHRTQPWPFPAYCIPNKYSQKKFCGSDSRHWPAGREVAQVERYCLTSLTQTRAQLRFRVVVFFIVRSQPGVLSTMPMHFEWIWNFTAEDRDKSQFVDYNSKSGSSTNSTCR